MAHWLEPQPIAIPDPVRRVVPLLGGWETLVAELLVRRGMTDAVAARAFLDPCAYTPASPYELPGLEATVERLAQAITQGERITVWGDFDVDGQTATALYLEVLQALGANVGFTIPTRQQSHGVHPAGVQRLIQEGTQLILTADTGVSAHTAIDLARRQGVDVLVTDHHDLPPKLPDALCLVDPKQLPDDHPLYGLPGVGVAYPVMRALADRMGRSQEMGERTLDLVALGIVADVALLRADTRYLLQRGLKVLRGTHRPGLLALMDLAELEPAFVSEEDIGFALAPRLNALNRVAQDPEIALSTTAGVELLTTADLTRARTLATALEALNARRRWLTRQTTEAAIAQLERDRSLLDRPALVLAGENWDPGIVGIVAGQLVERYHRPALVLSAPPGGVARGSARSIEGIDVHAAIAGAVASADTPDILYRYGGHPMAAGLSLDEARIPEFRRALWQTLERTAPPPSEPDLAIDAVLGLDQLTLPLVRALDTLSPFGLGNEAPVLAARDLAVVSSRIIGRTREHRRLVVRDGTGREQAVLWWRSADQSVPEGPFDLAFRVGVHRFRGEESVQLTWVEARSLAPPTPVIQDEPVIAVHDRRDLAELSLSEVRAAMQTWLAPAGQEDGVQVWGEGLPAPDGVPMRDRRALQRAGCLVIWTAPPGPDELHAALETVSPQEVVLLCVDPGLDAPRAFLARLAGLVKYALREYEGHTRLSTLSAAMAHTPWAVRLGLQWMAARGQIVVGLKGDRVILSAGCAASATSASLPLEEELVQRLEGQFYAQLEETAAYRAYVRAADSGRLVSE